MILGRSPIVAHRELLQHEHVPGTRSRQPIGRCRPEGTSADDDVRVAPHGHSELTGRSARHATLVLKPPQLEQALRLGDVAASIRGRNAGATAVLLLGLGRPSASQRWAPLRTGRSTFTASGSSKTLRV